MKQRPTGNEARIKRHMRQAKRRALVATRAAAKAAHHDSLGTAASHLRAMGADDKTATGMAATLRRKVVGRGVKGIAKKNGIRRACTRYTRGQILTALIAYKPRKAEYKDARRHAITQLLALAA